MNSSSDLCENILDAYEFGAEEHEEHSHVQAKTDCNCFDAAMASCLTARRGESVGA